MFARALNISQHGNFDFLLYGNADLADCTSAGAADLDGKKVFFLRVGSEKDYYEVQVPINFCGWEKISVTQADLTGDQIPDAWQIGSAPDGSVALSTGNPNLQQIGSLIAGVRSLGDLKNSGSVYLNELHLSNPLTRKGTAYRGQADFTVPGWMSFGGKYRYVDRNYETPTTLVSNQDNRQINGYLSFSRLSFFPMNFNYAQSRVETPNVNAVGNLSNTVSLLSAGRVETESLTASGNFSLGAYPKLTLSHERNSIDYALARRLDARRTYRGGLTYSVPWKSRLLPRSVEANYSRSSYDVEYAGLETRVGETLFNTNELTHAYGGRLVFEPWNGSNFSPNFNATQVKEDRRDFLTGRETRQTYPKSYNQSVGFNSTWKLLRWFVPTVSYTVNTIENNNLQPTTVTVRGTDHRFDIGEIKTLNRNSNGNISLTLNAAEIMTRTKLWRSFSLTNGYQLTDGDVWNNVERDMDTRTRFWLRSPLRPSGPAAQRANLTLRDNFTSSQRWSPLEAYELGGRGAALQTLSISNNFTKSVQRSETTGTPSKTISTTLPDLIASLSQIEKLTFTERWLKNFQINLKYSLRETLNVSTSREKNDSFGTDLRSIVKDRFDTSLSFNLRSTKNEDLRIGLVTQKSNHKDATLQSTFDMNKFRFTPKVDYSHDVAALGSGQKTADIQVVTPSMLIRADISMPQGLKLPFRDKPLPFTNRIIWTTTLSMAMRSSPVTITDNSKLANFNTSADYEISKNLRMTLNASASRLWHKYLKEEDYLAYQFGTVLTLQF
ncbi:MAG TPA: hypothetical protein DD417_10740 [Elusimicrobia bacterium]|nr:hypothetical protein [Elusimicrobiota bacterium]